MSRQKVSSSSVGSQLLVTVFLPNAHIAKELAQKIMENIRDMVGEHTHIYPEGVTYYRENPRSAIEVDQEASLMFRIIDENNKDIVLNFVKSEHPLDTPEILVTRLVD